MGSFLAAALVLAIAVGLVGAAAVSNCEQPTLQRKPETETGAGSRNWVDPQIAPVIEHGLTCQGQSDPQAILLSTADKRLEEPRADLFRNSRAGVLHAYQYRT